MRTWEVTGLIGFEDKNGDGRIQYYNDRNDGFAATAAERGWAGNEFTFNNDILVLANPEIANLPGWVIALIAAGGLAAALSTAAGLLLAISSAISHDLIKSTLNPNISERGELLAARIAMAGAIVLATYLGLNPPGFAAQVVALAFGLAAATIFPALMMGIFSKRVNSLGAIAGMLTGLIVTCLYLFTYLGWFFLPGTNMLPNTADNWLFGISPLAFGPIGALMNFAAAYIVSSADAGTARRDPGTGRIDPRAARRRAAGPLRHPQRNDPGDGRERHARVRTRPRQLVRGTRPPAGRHLGDHGRSGRSVRASS
jgi:cation/acetate symporter